jgi:hypothetical protein
MQAAMRKLKNLLSRLSDSFVLNVCVFETTAKKVLKGLSPSVANDINSNQLKGLRITTKEEMSANIILVAVG